MSKKGLFLMIVKLRPNNKRVSDFVEKRLDGESGHYGWRYVQY